MTQVVPYSSPAEGLRIAPEALEVANAYLSSQDATATAVALNIPLEVVSNYLARPEVKSYINQVFFDIGYNNRFKMRRAMDALIQKKFQDMAEADVGSGKDIADLLALSHKMSMELLQHETALEKLKHDHGVKSQVNVQINGDGTKYGALISKLLEGNV